MKQRPVSGAIASLAAALAVAFAMAAPAAAAADFPVRPVTLIVPFTPGGATDVMGRALADEMSKHLGQPVVVENRPGANTIVGAEQLARSDADGYTLMVAAGSTMVLNPLLYDKLSYDPQKDMEIISLVGEIPLIALVPMSSPARTLAEFVDYAKKQKGKLNFASVGTGSTLHLAGELFKQEAGVDMTHVPYKGSAPAITDLIGGQVDLMFDAYATAYPQIEGGRLRALAVASEKRLPTLPDVPTLAETYPGYLTTVWYGVIAPDGVPDEVKTAIKSAIDKTLETPDFRQRVEKSGFVVSTPHSAEHIKTYLDNERTRWSGLIKAQNIRLDSK
jgi:tripartite-type tricarboxylate transporter receptor subunit TctC